MTEYLSKKAVLEFLKKQISTYGQDSIYFDGLCMTYDEIESGALNADNSEIQRLRAALEEAQQFIHGVVQSCEITEFIDYGRIISEGNQVYSKISEALSTTTEPTGAERVREIECPCCGCEISINAKEGDGNDI